MKGEKLDGSLKYKHLAKVTIKPFHQFPIDMLRYDRCMPYREVDSYWIQTTGHNDKPAVLVVIQYSFNSKAEWTTDRWSSFGATIEPITESEVNNVRLLQQQIQASNKVTIPDTKPQIV